MWELIFKISFIFLIIISHVIPVLIAIYYLIKEKQWFLLIPMSVIFAIPIIGTLASCLQIISEGEEFNLGDIQKRISYLIHIIEWYENSN